MGSAIGHFKTITKHRHKVISHCRKAGILWQGLRHDLSKYSPAEFIPGAKYYLGTRSPNEAEREKQGYSMAWMHHKGRNRHHYEYWTDINLKTKQIDPVKMPAKYLAEMFCDRVAAGKIYNGKNYTNHHPLDYFMKGKARHHMHPETSKELEKMLTILAEKGEDAAFEYVRTIVKKGEY
ncbi:MAG: catalase [Oscillospiraceae bacterium]|nr:catalase [Oscillospiraceae bacterium]